MSITNEKTVIGLDFGTLSARAALVSCSDGQVLASSEYVYPHGVIGGELPNGRRIPDEYALADAADYREALVHCIRGVSSVSDISGLKGICVAATTYTMVPCLQDGFTLTENGYKNEPHAYIKLWKHHGAKKQADRIEKLHEATGGLPTIENYGGAVNCEWALPKLLETYEEAPEIFAETYRFCDLGEWLTWQLTGEPVNSLYSAGFKGMWTPEEGFPQRDILNQLADGFGEAFYSSFAGAVSEYGEPCGYVSSEMAVLLGIPEGVPVAAPIGDGSAPGVCFCVNDPDAIAVTLGTSIAMAFLNARHVPVSGINGVVKDGIVPGDYGYDSGQPCAGDMLNWFVENQMPESYIRAAQNEKKNIFDFLAEKTTNPWDNPLTVLDWWNGNRGILNDSSLKGSILGCTMATKPEDIYCAMVQGMACGTRKIIDHLEQNGLTYRSIVLCGGMAEKNRFIVQQYANILNRPVKIAQQRGITALSAAIFAANAAGEDLKTAAGRMVSDSFVLVLPEKHEKEYGNIYNRWCFYHDLLGNNRYEGEE